MGAVTDIENRVRQLTPEELSEFRSWFAEFDAQQWDEQIARDLASGKLDGLIAEALADREAGIGTHADYDKQIG